MVKVTGAPLTMSVEPLISAEVTVGAREINDGAGRKRDLAGKIRTGVELERAGPEEGKRLRVGRANFERPAATDRSRSGAGNGGVTSTLPPLACSLPEFGNASSIVSVPPPVASKSPELLVWLPVSMTISLAAGVGVDGSGPLLTKVKWPSPCRSNRCRRSCCRSWSASCR